MIEICDVALKFRLYHDKGASLKEWFTNLRKGDQPGGYSDFWALDGINLTLEHGERVGIIGHNGAGKSTLLKTVCRIYTPTRGTIRLTGTVAPLLEIGAGFNYELSGRDNILLNGAILGHNRRFLKSVEAEIIDFTGMESFIDTPVKYYSSGMQQRLGFAIATSVHPDILIMDEVFAGGDADFVQRAQLRLERFIDQSNITVLVSHDMEHIRRFCNRVIWLDHGKVIGDGEPETMIKAYLARNGVKSDNPAR